VDDADAQYMPLAAGVQVVVDHSFRVAGAKGVEVKDSVNREIQRLIVRFGWVWRFRSHMNCPKSEFRNPNLFRVSRFGFRIWSGALVVLLEGLDGIPALLECGDGKRRGAGPT
jgi:hypothetical protein